MARRKRSQAREMLARIRLKHLYMVGVGLLILALSSPLLKRDRVEKAEWEEDPSFDTRVLVLNGCGTEGVADDVSACLRDAGFDIVGTGNADAFDYQRTIVIDRCGSREKAQRVGDALECERVMLQRATAPVSDVIVVVGADWGSLKALREWKKEASWGSRR
ncbi:MAG: LytR C-terminal domain-containing protein [Candidatus Eiseniibacteriota bacterium]|nr:MAG: LytR C-terminal domain-containing protein [Candidatus Eisenbacteria bacterium]